MSKSSLEERLTELEVRIAFLDDALLAFTQTVTRHERILQTLQTEFSQLRTELSGVRLALAHDVREELPPPHY